MPSPTNGTILSSTGTPAFVPPVNAVNAGLMLPGQYLKLLNEVEVLSNKQNSMLNDGTGTKYPTVDAVNLFGLNILKVTASTGFIDRVDDFSMELIDPSTIHITASDPGAFVRSKLFATPPIFPADAVVNITERDYLASSLTLPAADGRYFRFIGYNYYDDSIVNSPTSYYLLDSIVQLAYVEVLRSGGVNTFTVLQMEPDLSTTALFETVMIANQTTVVVVPNIPPGLTINSTQGLIKAHTINWGTIVGNLHIKVHPAEEPASFLIIDRSYIDTATPVLPTTNVNVSQYWNPITQLRETIPNPINNCTIQRWLLTLDGRLIQQLGDKIYTSKANAEKDLPSATFENIFPSDIAIEICKMIAVKNATDLTDLTKVQFYYGGGGGGGSSAGATTLDSLVDVEIVNPLDAHVLTYETSTQLWKNKPPVGGGGGTITGTGTPGVHAMWTGPTALADSSISETASLITLGLNTTVSGALIANSFSVPLGSSSQFLKANGSLDSNVYALDSALSGKQDFIIAGTALQYYRGDKTFQTLNTLAVPELTNLYYTEARVSANTDVAANTAARHAAVTLGTANGLSLAGQVLSMDLADTDTTGALSFTDWNTFNNKQSSIGFTPVPNTRLINTTSPLQGGGNLTADRTISIPVATGSADGYLSSTDWSTFSGKEPPIAAGTAAQYYRGDKTFQTLNTSIVPELTNLYYTEARVSANTDVVANTAARNKWDGSAIVTPGDAAAARTSLGATTIGGNIFTSANPSAITFLRANATNTVSWLSASAFRTAIGAGTGNGTVTSVSVTLGTTGTDIAFSVATPNSTPAITLNIPTASGSNRGALSSADWTTFNNKQPGDVGLTSLAGLAFTSVGFVKQTALDTFAIDTNTYALSSSLAGKQDALTGPGLVKAVAGVITYVTDNSTNWDTAYTDRMKWDGGSTGLNAATGRTSLEATVLGTSIFKSLDTPTSIRFLQANADNTVSWLSDSQFRTAIGVGTGTVTSVTGTGTVSGITLTSSGTTAVTLTLGGALSLALDGLSDVAVASPTDAQVLVYEQSTLLWKNKTIATGGGTVTSVALTMPSIFSVGGSPVTGAGTLATTLVSQTAKTFFAAPNATDDVPAFRLIVSSDIPTLNQSTTGSAGFLSPGANIQGVLFTGATNINIINGTGFVKASGTTITYDSNTYLTANQSIVLSGDVSGTGSTAITTAIGANKVTLAMMAQITTDSFLGRDTTGTGNVEVLSVATVKTLLGISGTNTGDQTITLTGPVTGSGTGSFATTITDKAVTLAKMADMATASFLGRNTAAVGVPEVLSIATAKTMLNLSGNNTGDQTITLTGDVTGSGTGSFAATIANKAVTLAKMADIATDSFLGRDTTGTGVVEVLSVSTVKTLLNLTGTNSGDQTITLTGDVTGSGTGSFAATLSNTGVTANTYNNVTVDAKGRVTAGSNVAYGTGTVTSVTGSGTIAGITLTQGGTAAAITLTLTGALVATGAAFGSKTATYVLAAPTASAGTPDFRPLVAADIPTLAPINSPTFTGVPLSTTPTAGDSSTKIATTAFVAAAITTAGGITFASAIPTFTAGPNSTVVTGDTLEVGLEKLQGQIDNKQALDSTLTELAKLAWVSGTPFVKMNSDSTFSLDTNTYFIVTSQSPNQIYAGPASGSGTPLFRTMVTADIANNIVTLAKLATIATNRILGRVTASTGNVEVLTPANVLTILGATTTGTALLTAPANTLTNKFLQVNVDSTVTWNAAPAQRTALGATTLGANIFTSPNITLSDKFPRANYLDNTVSWLDAAAMRVALGVGTGTGSVTYVDALAIDSVGTDITSSVANPTTTPVITLNIPDASVSSRGALTSTDWSTFNNKQEILDGTGVVKSAAGTIEYLVDTTVGRNILTSTDPTAITFLRANADNTVSWLTASAFRTAIGAGTSSTSGTVTSVGLALPSIFTITVSPISSSGTLTATLATQTANTIFAGPTAGGALVPTFRAMVSADIPSSVALAGSPTTTTQTTGDNSTKIATTAFVANAMGSFVTLGTAQTITAIKTFSTYTEMTGILLPATDFTIASATRPSIGSSPTHDVTIRSGNTLSSTAVAELDTSLLTVNRKYTFQNGSGTLAFTSDIPAGTGGTVTSVGVTTPIGTAGTAPAWSVSQASPAPVITLNIPMASATGVTAGLLSKTDYDTFNGKINFASTITGFAVGSNTTVTSSDSLEVAIEKLQGQVNARQATITNPVTGLGTGVNGTIPKWTGANSLGNSVLSETASLLTSTLDMTINSVRTGRGISSSNANNTVFGALALNLCTGCGNSTAIGYGTLAAVVSASENTALGNNALGANIACCNIAIGHQTLTGINNAASIENVAIGNQAGYQTITSAVNTNSIKSVYIGHAIRTAAIGSDNEIVIGNRADGAGTNSVTLGNASILKTILRGRTLINGAVDSTTHALQVLGTANAGVMTIDMPAVTNNPPAGVPDALFITVRGHNGASTNYTSGIGVVIGGNRSGGIYVANSASSADSTNSFAVDVEFKANSTSNTAFRVRKGTTVVSSILDSGAAFFEQLRYTRGIENTSNADTILDAGFYLVDNASITLNLPGGGWWYLTVERHTTNNYVHQTATSFGAGNTANQVFTRVLNGGVWTAWVQVVTQPNGMKVWRGTITQSSTGNPTVVEFENTFGGTISWTRTGTTGSYLGTLTGMFSGSKGWVQCTPGLTNGVIRAYRTTGSQNSITILTATATGTASDGILNESSIEIRSYL